MAIFSKNSAAKAVIGLRTILEKLRYKDGRTDLVIVGLDVKAAFDSISRTKCIKALAESPLKPLARTAWATMRPESTLVQNSTDGTTQYRTNRGVKQGAPLRCLCQHWILQPQGKG